MQSRNVRIEDNLIDGAKFGGIFVIGEDNVIARNRLLNLNTAHCNEEAARFGCYYAPGEPDMLRSGIYLGSGAERPAPARGNRIEENEITGYEMDRRCIGGGPQYLSQLEYVRVIGVGETFFSTQRRRERGGTAEKTEAQICFVFSALLSAFSAPLR